MKFSLLSIWIALCDLPLGSYPSHVQGLPQKTNQACKIPKLRDPALLQVRADEYSHSHVNHTFSKLKHEDQNPFEKGAHTVPWGTALWMTPGLCYWSYKYCWPDLWSTRAAGPSQILVGMKMRPLPPKAAEVRWEETVELCKRCY